MEADQKKRPILRYLRIAFSAVCRIVCLLLIGLWVRSYQTLDNLSGHLPGIKAISCTSAWGRVAVGIQIAPSQWKWNIDSFVLDEESFGGRPKEPRSWFIFNRSTASTALQVPHGFLVLLAGTVAIMPWLRWRFSLRTLLIGTTLIAIVLGILAISN